MVGVNERLVFVGTLAVVVAAAGSSLHWGTSGVVAAGLIGGLVVGLGADGWSDTTLNGMVAGALGSVCFFAGFAALTAFGGIETGSVDLTLNIVVLTWPFVFLYAVLATPLFVVEGAIGAILGRRLRTVVARVRSRSVV